MTPTEIVARVILWSRAQGVGTEWENYPEITEENWQAVVEEIKRLVNEDLPDKHMNPIKTETLPLKNWHDRYTLGKSLVIPLSRSHAFRLGGNFHFGKWGKGLQPSGGEFWCFIGPRRYQMIAAQSFVESSHRRRTHYCRGRIERWTSAKQSTPKQSRI